MIKLESICSGRNEEFSVVIQCFKNNFWIWSKKCIVHGDLLGHRTRNKFFVCLCVGGEYIIRFTPKY